MAQVRTRKLMARHADLVEICGQLVLDGSNGITSQDIFGATASIANTDQILLTLEGTYAKLYGLSVTQVSAEGALGVWIVLTDSVATAKTLEIGRIADGASTTGTPPAATYLVRILLKNASNK